MSNRLDPPIAERPPCKNCSERCVTASFNCHDSCPKDKRGEFGYKAWKEKLDRVNTERKKYKEKPFVQYNPFDY